VLTLIAILWAVYLSECFVRWRPGDTIVRAAGTRAAESVNAPDVTLFRERVGFVWTTPLPWRIACVFSGHSMDTPRGAITRIHRDTRWVRITSTLLFAVVMVVFPGLVFTERVLPWLPLFALALAAAWSTTLGAYWFAHRRVHGAAPAIETWLVLALSPVSLMRAPLAATLYASPRTHPLVGVDALCDDKELLRVARLWCFDEPLLRPDIERLLSRRGLLPALTAPPKDSEPGVTRFCPRCHATFVASATICTDCDGVRLTPTSVR
jgi:hypothetical protein